MNHPHQITQLRLPGGASVSFVDWQDTPLHSSLDFVNNFTDEALECFTYVQGDLVPTTANAVGRRIATEIDTNIDVAALMPGTGGMLIYSIRAELSNVTVAGLDPNSAVIGPLPSPLQTVTNIMVMENALLLKLFASQKLKHQAPLGYFNTGFGAFSSFGKWVNGAGGVTSVGNMGLPGFNAVRSYQIPINIGAQEPFRVEIANPDNTAVPFVLETTNGATNTSTLMMTMRIHLDGLHKRPVS